MTRVFISFGDGDERWRNCLTHIIRRAQETGLFDKVVGYGIADLENDVEFTSRHGEFVKNNRRGYGYWIWKPYLIIKNLEALKDGDTLLYLDCGTDIDVSEKDELARFLDLVKDELIISSYYPTQEKMWSKMDLILELGMNEPRFMESVQMQGGLNLIYNCDKTMNFVRDWYDNCCKYNLLDDSPSVNPNDPAFVEHRHDQSIFSLLFKMYDFSIKYLFNEHKCVRVWGNPHR